MHIIANGNVLYGAKHLDCEYADDEPDDFDKNKVKPNILKNKSNMEIAIQDQGGRQNCYTSDTPSEFFSPVSM
jgi:hypothetical protein